MGTQKIPRLFAELEEISVPMAQIDSEDTRFQISTDTDLTDLVASIGRIGLMRVPVVQAVGEGYRVVAGFRRVGCCRRLGWERLPVRLLPMEDVSCVRLAVADNAWQRPLNLIEQARAVQLLSTEFPQPQQLSREAADLGLSANPGVIAKLKRLLNLDRKLQAAVADGRLSLAMALELERRPRKAAGSLADIFMRLKLGLNRQRELLNLIDEIARREGLAMDDVLAAVQISAIMVDHDLSLPQKGQRLREYLKKRCYPVIVQAETFFQDLLERLDLGPGVILDPPPYFEGSRYQLKLAFDSPQQLRRRLATVAGLGDNPQVETLLSGKWMGTLGRFD